MVVTPIWPPLTSFMHSESNIQSLFLDQWILITPFFFQITDPNSKIKDARQIRRSQSGSYHSGINNSCYYHVGVYCDCNKSYASPVVIWPPKSELEFRRFFYPLHIMMMYIQRKMKCLPSQLDQGLLRKLKKRKCLRN